MLGALEVLRGLESGMGMVVLLVKFTYLGFLFKPEESTSDFLQVFSVN